MESSPRVFGNRNYLWFCVRPAIVPSNPSGNSLLSDVQFSQICSLTCLMPWGRLFLRSWEFSFCAALFSLILCPVDWGHLHLLDSQLHLLKSWEHRDSLEFPHLVQVAGNFLKPKDDFRTLLDSFCFFTLRSLYIILMFNLSTKKDVPIWELQAKYYLGENEDCSLEGSISYSSERLFQSCSGGRSIYTVLLKGEFGTMRHVFTKGFLLVMRIWWHHEGI